MIRPLRLVRRCCRLAALLRSLLKRLNSGMHKLLLRLIKSLQESFDARSEAVGKVSKGNFLRHQQHCGSGLTPTEIDLISKSISPALTISPPVFLNCILGATTQIFGAGGLKLFHTRSLS